MNVGVIIEALYPELIMRGMYRDQGRGFVGVHVGLTFDFVGFRLQNL